MYVNKIISNNIGYLILNRTKKLNALNIDMIRELREKYCDFIKNDNVKIIVLKGNNNKNFCAGGDIVTLYKEYIINNNSPMFFFEEEFELDYLLFNSKKPIISFISGITMGGGVGLSITSSIVVADDTTKWAMPETRLGMIPDVGVGYYFSKIEKPLALYISLLGNILFGSDLTKLNIADFYIKNSSIRNIEIELEQFDFKNLSFDEMVF
ncbi:enoyl-CoA hydratase/isomerase family protein [Peptoniphilus sp. oral taxon 386]|nr:enoyl-CoA hydratase/isomerase family protein [Peptoniphilus sp. oral taxon 386]